jgi:hypothetical protein
MEKNGKKRLFEVMGRLDNSFKPDLNEMKDDPCWDDYEMVGMKKKDGKEVPNCVPKNESDVSVEPQEHGEEGPNYKAKLEQLVDNAKKVYEGLPEGEIPSWVQDKITKADDYLEAIFGWMHSEEEEKEGEIEGANREMDDEEIEL